MEILQDYIVMDAVPPSWEKRAYPSELGLNSWFADLLNRISELTSWTADFNVKFPIICNSPLLLNHF